MVSEIIAYLSAAHPVDPDIKHVGQDEMNIPVIRTMPAKATTIPNTYVLLCSLSIAPGSMNNVTMRKKRPMGCPSLSTSSKAQGS